MALVWQIFWWIVVGGITLWVLVAAAKTRRPVRALLSSGVQGLCGLAAVNVVGAFTGVSLGLNWYTGVCCVLLGIPGVVLILLERLILSV